MRWVEMRWDDTDCGDSGMQWTISKRSCDAMRSDEMRRDSTLKRHGVRLTNQKLVAAKPGGLPVTYRHSLCSALKAISVSILKLPPPACPGTNCMMGCGVVRVLLTLLPPFMSDVAADKMVGMLAKSCQVRLGDTNLIAEVEKAGAHCSCSETCPDSTAGWRTRVHVLWQFFRVSGMQWYAHAR